MEAGRVIRSRLLVGSAVGDRCITGRLHKMQKETFFKYKPKTEIHLLQSFAIFDFFHLIKMWQCRLN